MFFFESISIEASAFWIALFVGLIVFNEISRRTKAGGLVLFVALPIVLTVFVWPNTAVEGSGAGNWFQWAKVYSALAGCIGFMILRYVPKLQTNKFMLCFPPLILSINILEAVIRDIQCAGFSGVVDGVTIIGGPWNYINAAAGILNILTICGWMGIFIGKTKSKDMVWPDMMWFWIIAYDIWNIAYVYNSAGDRAFYSIALLLAPTVVAFTIGKGAWLQHRAHTLALDMMLLLTIPSLFLDSVFTVPAVASTTPNMVLSCVALAANIAVVVYHVYKIVKTKRSPIKGRLYADSKFYQRVVKANTEPLPEKAN